MGEAPGRLSTLTIADGNVPLPGYARRTVRGAELVATEQTIEALVAVLLQHGTLYDWARREEQPRALRGRAPVYVATIPGLLHTTVVVRHAWHGGVLAPMTGDRFLRPTRAPVELLRSVMLRECGVPTPELIGFALYTAGPGLARVDVATRYIPASFDLAAVLAELAPAIPREVAFEALHHLLRQLAQYGFTHPDLNVKNILLFQDTGVVLAAVLDVDVMRWNREMSAEAVMALNANRLLRSLLKARQQFGIRFTDADGVEFMHRASRGLPSNPGLHATANDSVGAASHLPPS